MNVGKMLTYLFQPYPTREDRIAPFTDTANSQRSRGREETIFYSTVPLPLVHEHSDIYLKLCMRDDYQVFLIATLVFTTMLLDEIYHLIELPFD